MKTRLTDMEGVMSYLQPTCTRALGSSIVLITALLLGDVPAAQPPPGLEHMRAFAKNLLVRELSK